MASSLIFEHWRAEKVEGSSHTGKFTITSGRHGERRTAHAALRQARRGLLDRALPAARHRAGVVRGLDLARVLRARAQRDLRPHLAQRRPGRAARRSVGSYFTRRSTPPARRSIVVRAADGVRAFHNICRHRGNKLVWQDYPGEETSGTCRQFTCKYHGWRYALEGDLNFVQQEGEFFDLDKADYGLAPVRVDTWEGFIFVNLDNTDTTPLRDYLGELGQGPRGLPVRRDDAGLQVPGGGREQLEALHRRLHRVLPRTRAARAPGGVGGVGEAAGLRLRGARVRHRRSARRWCRRGAACRRRRTSTW